MNKQKIFFISALSVLGAGLFFFFYVPKSPCVILRDPSGKPSEVCDLGGRQSPYQKIFLKMHMYFYPNDTCMIRIQTGEVDCGSVLSLLLPTCDQSATTTDCGKIGDQQQAPLIATSTSMSGWKIFENTEYGYSVLMNQKDSFGSFGGYSLEDISKDPIVYIINRTGETGQVAIRVETISLKLDKEKIEQQKKLFALDLKSYSEAIRNFQANNIPYLEFGVMEQLSQEDLSLVNFPIFPNKKVGELKEIQFAGFDAYEFVVEGMNGLFLGPSDGHGGYVLAQDVPQKYIILENPRGQKMIIYYTVNIGTEKMVQSIKFTSTR